MRDGHATPPPEAKPRREPPPAPPRTPGRWRRHGTVLVTEVVAVVLGVLLALAANEWRQASRDRALVERVEGTLRAETVHNRELVAAALDHRRAMTSEIREALREYGRIPLPADGRALDAETALRLLREHVEPGIELTLEAGDDGGFTGTATGHGATERIRARRVGDELIFSGQRNIQLGSADLVTSAWETVQATGATVHLEYEVVEIAARIHQQHLRYRDLVRSAVRLIYFANVFGGSIGTLPEGFVPLLQDMMNAEQELLRLYDELLQELDADD